MATVSASYEIPPDMMQIINIHTGAMGGIGIIGGLVGPGADLPAIAVSWVTMTIQLASEAGHQMSRQTAKKLCLAVATGAGTFLAGTKIAATAAGWLTAFFTAGVSLVLSAAGNAALNAAFTRAYGKACARYFLQVHEIDTLETLVKILIAMIGIDMGIDMGGRDLVGK